MKKCLNYLNEKEREILLNQINEINLNYDIEASAITDSILYMFLYHSNFYSYVEIDEITIHSSFNNLNANTDSNNIIENALEKLTERNILFYRQGKYILNNEILKNIN